jgi:soluble lytic murein transglycosylase-like protein
VDAQGVKHFASSQLDSRYKLLFRGIPAVDTAGLADTSPVTSAQRMVFPGASGRSVASLELSPGFMAIKPLVRAAADANQLDMALLQAVIATESGFVASAVSPKGAVGLMQVMPATAQRYGLTSDRGGSVATKLTDPKTNIHTGARYLRDLINLFPGQLELAVAAYNAGEGAVQKAGNKIPNFKETQNYVRSVMQLYKRLNPLAQPASTVVATAAPAARVRGEFRGAATNPLDVAASAELPPGDLSN